MDWLRARAKTLRCSLNYVLQSIVIDARRRDRESNRPGKGT